MAVAEGEGKEDGMEVFEVLRRFISTSEVDRVLSNVGQEENDGMQGQPLIYQSKLNNN